MSDFDGFVGVAVIRGDGDTIERMWREEYARERQDGWTALHWACYIPTGYDGGVVEEVVQALLVDGRCKIEAETDDKGWRPLHLCALYGNQRAMPVLLEAGCCLTALTRDGETPLQIAERKNHSECTKMLRMALQAKEVSDLLELLRNNSLSKIMDLETRKTLLDKLLDSKDQRALEAIKAKQVDEREIQEWTFVELNLIDSQSLQSLLECLMYRCIHQKYDRCVYSLCTANIVNKASLFMGPTALETVVDCGAVVWVHEILRKLVKVDESWSAAEDITTKKNLSDIANLISKRRDYLNHMKEKGISRLHIAVIENDPDMIKYLINKGLVDVDEIHENFGRALSLANNLGHIDCVQSLQDINVNVNTVDKPPLHAFIAEKKQDIIDYLMDYLNHLDLNNYLNIMEPIKDSLNERIDELYGIEWVIEDESMSQLSKIEKDLEVLISNIPRDYETIYSLCQKSNETDLSSYSFMSDLYSQILSATVDSDFKTDSEGTPILELFKQGVERKRNEVETKYFAILSGVIDSQDLEDADLYSVLIGFKNKKLKLELFQKCEDKYPIYKARLQTWFENKKFTLIREVIPLIDKAILNEWITRELIIDRLADNDISLTTAMYDYGSNEVKTGVVEGLLYRAAIVGDRALFERIIKDDISANSCLDGGESLLHCLIRERKTEFIQLVIGSKNRTWFIKKNTLNKLPLHVCIEDDYWEVTDQLIGETSSVNEQDNDGNTALSLLLTKISETEDDNTIGRLMTSVKLLINKSASIYLVNRLNKEVISYCTKSDLRLKIESLFKKHQEEQMPICPICRDNPMKYILNCGHMLCTTCANQKDCHCCPYCRKTITQKIKIFF